MGKRGPSTHLFWTLFFSLFLFCGLSRAETKPVGFAVPFADLTFKQTLSKEEQAYLGLPRKTNFSFREIKGDLILVEFISTYCVNCQRQAPVFSELFLSIEKNPALKGKVKMIGIAAGNTLKEVEHFKKNHKIPYPIFADQRFDAHTAVGGPRTPFSIWVRKEAHGKAVVVSTHLGLIDSMEKALNETRAVLQYDLALLKPRKGSIYEGDALKPPLTEEELTTKAKESMETSGGKVQEIEKISLKDGVGSMRERSISGHTREISFQNWQAGGLSVISATTPFSSIPLIPGER